MKRHVDHHGYIRLFGLPGGRWEYEHRWIVSQQIGRPLTRYEHVHHRNGDKQDNRPDNLQLMTWAEHVALHNRVTPRRGPRGAEATRQKKSRRKPNTHTNKLAEARRLARLRTYYGGKTS